MRRGTVFLLVLAALGAGLMLLVVNHGAGTTFGMANDRFASVLAIGAWAAVLGAAILRSRSLGETARQLLVWLLIVLALIAGYLYRDDLRPFAARMTAGLIPGLPITRTSADGRGEVVLYRSSGGHFETTAAVNGRPVRFLIDTGATSIALSYEDAAAIGIDPDALSFTQAIQTANGPAKAAAVLIDRISIGPIARERVRATVSPPGVLPQSLLGMNFLETLSAFHMSRDELVLRD